MKQYRLALSDCERPEERIPASRAYPLYAWLLTQLPEQAGAALHEQGEKPISQYLHYASDQGKTIWTVTFLSDRLAEEAAPVFQSASSFALYNRQYLIQPLSCQEIPSAQALTEQARREQADRYTTFELLSPVSFRQNKRYVLFPQERLVIQSLLSKWNLTYPACALDSADVLGALEQDIHIVDYRLHTARYSIKNVKIPGFCGTLTLESRLSHPLDEIWRSVALLAPYCGLGIKTTLGMGGVSLVVDR